MSTSSAPVAPLPSPAEAAWAVLDLHTKNARNCIAELARMFESNPCTSHPTSLNCAHAEVSTEVTLNIREQFYANLCHEPGWADSIAHSLCYWLNSSRESGSPRVSVSSIRVSSFEIRVGLLIQKFPAKIDVAPVKGKYSDSDVLLSASIEQMTEWTKSIFAYSAAALAVAANYLPTAKGLLVLGPLWGSLVLFALTIATCVYAFSLSGKYLMKMLSSASIAHEEKLLVRVKWAQVVLPSLGTVLYLAAVCQT